MLYADSCCDCWEDSENYIFRGPCVRTGKQYIVTVPKQELYAYRQGQKIQESLISVSVPDREFLMSGISPEGWKQIFPG